jgi:fatty acid desaturase
MLRYRADIRTLGILCTYAALVALQWALVPSGVLGIALIGVTCVTSWLCAVIAHNTVHTPVFTKRWMNKVFQIWVSCSYGFPISDYIPGHNLSHHRFMQLREDVMRTSKVNFRWNLLNLLFFMPAVTPGILRGNGLYKKLMGERARAWRRQLLLEAVVVWTIKAAAIAIDWRKALLYVIVPHLFANFGIVVINFFQHDGCDENHPVNHSRNFTGRFLNYVALNNGYHGVHHDVPGMHWSLAPQAHAEKFHPTIHPALEQPSLPVYLFKAFIYPGKRLTYDGKPVVVTQAGDLDWVQPSDRDAKVEDDVEPERALA